VFFPVGLEVGLNTDDWLRIVSFDQRSRGDRIKRYQYLFYGTLLGGILAPIVHPLDWQRDWQVT
jgi:hypothetical protein